MFVFNRSALAVLAPIALLIAVVLWSNFDDANPARAPTVAAADHAPVQHAHDAVTLTASNNRNTTGR